MFSFKLKDSSKHKPKNISEFNWVMNEIVRLRHINRRLDKLIIVSLSILLFILVFAYTQRSHAGAAGGGASEWTQILNNIELVAQYKKQIEQYEALRRQFRAIQEENRSLNDRTQLADPNALLIELFQTVNRDRNLNYDAARLADAIKQQYPGYAAYTTARHGPDALVSSHTFRNYDDQTNRTITKALQTVGLTNNQMVHENQLIAHLQQSSQIAQTKQAALEVGNDIALAQLEQNRRLETLIGTQIQLQAEYSAAKQDREAKDALDADDYFDDVVRWKAHIRDKYNYGKN